MSYHSYNLGAIEDMGLNPYNITGNPVMALIAQLNRFAGKSITLKGEGCNATRKYLPGGALPLATTLSDKAAATATLIVYDAATCLSDVRFIDKRWTQNFLARTDDIGYVMANLNDITVRIAQFADSKGLNPAAVGITTVDPKLTPKMSPLVIASLGIVGVGLIFMLSRRK